MRSASPAKQRQREELERLLHDFRLLTVTRCPPGARGSDARLPRRGGGGVLPAHLNPMVLGA